MRRFVSSWLAFKLPSSLSVSYLTKESDQGGIGGVMALLALDRLAG
jgi:hypothetical protein